MSVYDIFIDRTEYAADVFEANDQFKDLRENFNNLLLELEELSGEKHRKLFLNFEETVQTVIMERIRIAYSIGYKDAIESYVENTYANLIKANTKNYGDTLILSHPNKTNTK